MSHIKTDVALLKCEQAEIKRHLLPGESAETSVAMRLHSTPSNPPVEAGTSGVAAQIRSDLSPAAFVAHIGATAHTGELAYQTTADDSRLPRFLPQEASLGLRPPGERREGAWGGWGRARSV